MSRRLRPVALAILVTFVFGLAHSPARVLAGDSPARAAFPVQAAGVHLASMFLSLEEDLCGMVRLADHVGGLWGWHDSVTLYQRELQTRLPAMQAELQNFGRYLSASGFAPELKARHERAQAEIIQRLRELQADLDRAQAETDLQQVPARLEQILQRMDSWRPAGPVPELPTVLPFGPAAAPPPVRMLSPRAIADPPAAVPVATGQPGREDRARPALRDADAAALQAIVQETGGSITALTRWVYEQVASQWYAGHVKSPGTVAADRKANDLDAAVFTVALLRQAGWPARYARGQVALGPPEWERYFGLNDGSAVARFLAATGRNVDTVVDHEATVTQVRVSHWWAEAYDTGAGRWLALDTGWKPQRRTGQGRAALTGFDISRYLYNEPERSPLESFAAGAAAATGTFGGEKSEPVPLPPGQAPALVLTVVGQPLSTASLPPGIGATVSVDLPGLHLELPLTDLGSQPLLLEYTPAADPDRQVMRNWNQFFFPGYLVQMQPTLLLAGDPLAKGDPVQPGSRQSLRITVRMGSLTETVERPVTAGNRYGLVIEPTPTDTETVKARRTAAAGLAGESQLQTIGSRYFARVDEDAARLGSLTAMRLAPGPQVAVTAFTVDHAWLAGHPYFSWISGLQMDAARVTLTPVDPAGDRRDERLFWVLLGAQAGWREGHNLTDLYGLEPGGATMTLLQAAVRQGSSLHWLCRANGDTVLPETSLSRSTQVQVQAAFDRGWLAVMPPGPVKGTDAYVVIDPDTGASGYYLGDGSNGQTREFTGLLSDAGTAPRLSNGLWVSGGMGRFIFDFRLPRLWRSKGERSEAQPGEQANQAGFAVVMMKPSTPWQIPCWEAEQILPPALADLTVCDEARALLHGLSGGLLEGVTFGVASEWESWAQVEALTEWWDRFKENPGPVISELRESVVQVWTHRQQIVDGLAENVHQTALKLSGLAEGTDAILAWELGYTLGVVAGMIATTVLMNGATDLIMEGAAALIRLAMAEWVAPAWRVLRASTRKVGQGLLALVRTVPDGEQSILDLQRFAQFITTMGQREQDFLLGALHSLSVRKFDLSKFAQLSEGVQGTLAKATQRLLDAAEQARADLAAGKMTKKEFDLAVFTSRTRVEQALEAAMSGPSRLGDGPLGKIIREALSELGMSETEFHLLRMLPVEDLTPEQIRILVAVRRRIPIPENATVAKTMKYDDFLALMAKGEEGTIGGHVALAEHLEGAVTAEDYKDLLALRTVQDWDYTDQEMIVELTVPLARLTSEGEQVEDMLQSPLDELLDGKGYWPTKYPSTRNGWTAYVGQRGVPEWIMNKPRIVPKGAQARVIGRNGKVSAVYQFDGTTWQKIGGEVLK